MKTKEQIINKIQKLEKENKEIDERLKKKEIVHDIERKDYTARLIRINQLNWVLSE